MMRLALFTLIVICATSTALPSRQLQGALVGDSNTFIAPKTNSSTPAAFIWIQGALTPAHVYTPLLKKIHDASSLSLWVGQPSFLGDPPEPARLSANIDDTLKKMYASGMPKDT